MLHLVRRGRLWVRTGDRGAKPVAAGGVAFLPHGDEHTIADDPTTPALAYEQAVARSLGAGAKVYGGGGPVTSVWCCHLQFHRSHADPVLRALPGLVILPPQTPETTLGGVVALLDREARSVDTGASAVARKLGEALTLQVLRLWFDRQPQAAKGWVGALKDARLSRAVAAIARDPSQGHTVGSLAKESGMSRSAFAAAFTGCVGEAPMEHVTRWRMHRATLLLGRGATIEEAAPMVGYQSTSAFSRVFARHVGLPPGEYRRRNVGVVAASD
jgi:AraC-like DNA-binding protein